MPRFPSAEALEVDDFSPSISTFNYDAVTTPNIIGIRNVASTSNLGSTTLRGNFFLKKKGAFSEIKASSKIERALLCLLQNLGGHVPPMPPVIRLPDDPKKLHELDRLCLFDSKHYEDKQGVSM